MTALDLIVAKFRKASPNVAAAFDEVQRVANEDRLRGDGLAAGIAALTTRVTLLETPPVVVPPPPPPPAVGGVLELSGTMAASVFAAAVAAAPAGALTVRPKAGATVTVNGGFAPNRKFLTLEGIVFDGQGVTANNWLPNCTDWTYRACTFRRYYTADPASHSEALYVGGGAARGLVDGCLFDDNGTTAHIFFTWFGGTAGAGAYDQSNYPRDICVKGSTFKNGRNPWFAIQYRDEIPQDAPISVDLSNTFVGPGSQRALRACP